MSLGKFCCFFKRGGEKCFNPITKQFPMSTEQDQENCDVDENSDGASNTKGIK
jgi:hypothetical protein